MTLPQLEAEIMRRRALAWQMDHAGDRASATVHRLAVDMMLAAARGHINPALDDGSGS